MKKILVTLFQLAVTIAVLYWVYHDPEKRAQMVEALRNAQYHWVAIGILAYVLVEIAAAFRWHVLLKVQGIHEYPELSAERASETRQQFPLEHMRGCRSQPSDIGHS